MNNPDVAIAFLHTFDLPLWHVRGPNGAALALNTDRQGELFLRSMLTERDTCYALHTWLPALHYGHEWPAATPASLFSWAVVNASATSDQRGPLPSAIIQHDDRHWRLHAIRPSAHSEVMERGYNIAAQIPLATAWDPLAGVPLPGSGGAYVVE